MKKGYMTMLIFVLAFIVALVACSGNGHSSEGSGCGACSLGCAACTACTACTVAGCALSCANGLLGTTQSSYDMSSYH